MRLLRRLRQEDGFGIAELAIAMAILATGILAVFALYTSSELAVRRASTTTTAMTVADSRLELFRAVTFDAIGLTSTQLATVDSTYTGDTAYRAPGTNLVNQAVTITSSSFTPTATVAGPDGRSYRVDIFATWRAVSGGRNVKHVTVVVRDPATPATTYARVATVIDRATG